MANLIHIIFRKQNFLLDWETVEPRPYWITTTSYLPLLFKYYFKLWPNLLISQEQLGPKENNKYVLGLFKTAEKLKRLVLVHLLEVSSDNLTTKLAINNVAN